MSCPKASKRPTADPQALGFPGRVPGAHFSCLLSGGELSGAGTLPGATFTSPSPQSVQHVPAACVQITMCPGSQPPTPGGNLLLSPEMCGSWTGQRSRSRRGEELSGCPWPRPRDAGLALGVSPLPAAAPQSACLGQLSLPGPEGGCANQPQLLLLQACHHFHTQQGLWGWRLFPDMYLSEERKQDEGPGVCQISRQERNPGKRPRIRRGEGHPPLRAGMPTRR